MEIKYIEGHTRELGAPPNWNPETSGPCVGLPIRDEVLGSMPVMVSRWQPTPEEISAIMSGAGIYLTVCGTSHPPVMLDVRRPPTETGTAKS